MKIEGMDAYSSTAGYGQELKTSTKENTKDDKSTVAAANLTLDNKNISQLSTYEKNELPVSDRIVIQAIEKANRAISGGNRKFEFSIHEKTKEIMVKVIDADTNEVIREIPPEKTLDMVAKMWEMAGIMVDEKR